MTSNKKSKSLSINDLGVVLTELYPVRAKWYNIGLQLLVPVLDLRRIESEYKNDHSTCLRQMLIKWLEMGSANWETMCKALECPIVSGEALVTKLRQKYCVGEEPTRPKKRKSSESLNPPGEPSSTKV